MNCRRTQDLIPLFIEGDLKTAKAGPVLSHLDRCPECAQIASEYRASQQWLKSYAPPDFEEEFFDGLRGGVLRELGASPSSKPRFDLRLILSPASFALASVVVLGLCLGLAMYAYSNRGDEIPPYLRGDAGLPQVPGLDARAPSDIEWKLPAAGPRVGRPRHPGRRAAPGVISRGEGRSLEPVDPVAVEAEPSRKALRIELQTGDPNIRIIWFAPGEDIAEGPKLRTSVETE